MARKPRSDAWHAGLTVAQLDQVYAWCSGESGYAGAARKLADEMQVRASVTAISNWYQIWPFRRALLTSGSMVEELKAAIRDLPTLNLNPDQIDQLGQAMFQVEAMRRMDPELFGDMRRLAQRDKEIDQNDRRIKLLEAKAEKADETEKALSDESLTDEQRRERIAKIYGRA